MAKVPMDIKHYKYSSRCDINRCSNKAKVTIGSEGASSRTAIILCEEHLRDLVLKGIDFLGEDFKNEVAASLVPAIEELLKKMMPAPDPEPRQQPRSDTQPKVVKKEASHVRTR